MQRHGNDPSRRASSDGISPNSATPVDGSQASAFQKLIMPGMSVQPNSQSQMPGMAVSPVSPSHASASQAQGSQFLTGGGDPLAASALKSRSASFPSISSASGGTIHHMGGSPLSSTIPPFVSPPKTPPRRPSAGSMSPGSSSPRAATIPTSPGSAFSVPSSKSPLSTPERARKRPRLEEKPPSTPETATYRTLILQQKLAQLGDTRECFNEHLTELFFLQHGGNLLDFHSWKRKPTHQLLACLQAQALPEVEIGTEKKINDEVKVITASGGTTPLATPVAIATTLPPAVSAIQHQGISASTLQSSASLATSSTNATISTDSLSLTIKNENLPHLDSTTNISSSSVVALKSIKLGGKPNKPIKSASIHDSALGSQEAIVERAKQEAQTMQRVADLRKDGMWSARRLPKVQEPPRPKAHWDYLLEEMTWLAADFSQERKWKKAGARKIARMISRYHSDLQQKEVRAEKEEAQRLRRIASNMAKMVKEFWGNIEKVVEYKQQSRLDEKRKKALDLHLSFIVDQTEKYSSWLTEGFTAGSNTPSATGARSIASDGGLSAATSGIADDGDFEPVVSSSDDEATIAQAEEDMSADHVSEELAELERESQLPIEELLRQLPPEVLEGPAPLADLDDKDKEEEDGDDEFSGSEDSDDEEETIAEQETQETADHAQELKDLEDENELSVDELRKRYAAAFEQDIPASAQTSATVSEESSEDDTADEDEDEDEKDNKGEENDNEADMPDDYLQSMMEEDVKDSKDAKDAKDTKLPVETHAGEIVPPDAEGPGKDLTDIAAQALSLQPTGYTLETTRVMTEVPFLLRGTLREYQHVGLDWLATMHARKLNGILADEMGLGKTIQTIAVLAHLACNHGVWGPHLIVVPTSVMLNWEMELKKWCPAFKILTYYGTQKERKLKRTGWTKTNAFHVCITSYKLVIQDHQAFRRKKWKYFILDEAQNIKNFKSQRWQMLLNFSSQRRLLLTGTPLQNSLMELWSLMHFLMPHVFSSHREFKEWFSNPLTSMIEGTNEYNDGIIRRLHKVLRPFLLRRLKADVEKQMPKKYEHVVMCRLSKRQRFLYDDFMSQGKTKETLASGHFMSVINILMQLRKVCNHPNLFDPRPIVSPFQMEGITYSTASVVLRALDKDPSELSVLETSFPELELRLPQFASHRVRKLAPSRVLIEEMDILPEAEPRPVPLCTPLQLRPQHLSSVPKSSVAHSPVTPISSVIQFIQAANGAVVAVSQPSASVAAAGHIMNGPSSLDSPRATLNLPQSSAVPEGKPVVRVSPLNHSESNIGAASIAASAAVKQQLAAGRRQQREEKARAACSPFYLAALAEKREKRRVSKLARLARMNVARCDERPVFGSDMCDIVDVLREMPQSDSQRNQRSSKSGSVERSMWNGSGYVHCRKTRDCENPYHPDAYWTQTQTLRSMLHTPLDYLEEMKDILERFVFCIPSVTSPPITMHVSHPPPSRVNAEKQMRSTIHSDMLPRATCLHPIESRMNVQFPEARLIQYDCGKLQTLDLLLRKLKSGDHRVLIFTQMTRMLDVLESFLSYHGHRYLRLDGTTKVEQRQILMDRFNADKRIFVFILSTRSGGIGVNLTGADTVVFYDSDWNPTMDAQAQDRCHRIGQTRDVHIYRLISEMTVEENILKKANQKRLLGDVAIEGGNFTTAFFKENTLKELFAKPSGLKDMVKQENKRKEGVSSQKSNDKPSLGDQPMQNETVTEVTLEPEVKLEPEDPDQSKENTDKTPSVASSRACTPSMKVEQLEAALNRAEEETDVQSCRVVKAEQKAELAEFDDAVPWDEREAENIRERETELSKVEVELSMLDKELTPVERYAVKVMEHQLAPYTVDELEKAEEEVSFAKQEWELSRLQALREEEERRAELEDDEMLFTYTRQDANNQVYICDSSGEHMPMWAPPTPPQDDNDVYMDYTVCFLYEPNTMPESHLPPVYIKKEHKRIRIDGTSVGRKHKVRKDDGPRVPRSLFDRPSKMLKLAKHQGLLKPFNKPTAILGRPSAALLDPGHDHPDWLIHEDWALLQAIKNLLELPLTLATASPAHIPNWDLVADVVNCTSRTYRSAKQCRARYEAVIVPREEGRILYDANPRKQKKTKGLYKTKNNRAMRTSQLFASDNNQSITMSFTLRFDSAKAIAAKRTPPLRSTLANPTLKNPKHTAVLIESGINYDSPLTPKQVADIRAERIAKEKKNQAAAAEQQAAARAAQQQQQQQQQAAADAATTGTTVVAAAATTVAPTTVQAAAPAGQMTIVQGTPVAVTTSGASFVATSLHKAIDLAVSQARLPPNSSFVVNAAPGTANAFATINKRINQAVTGPQPATTHVTQTSLGALSAVRAAGNRTTTPQMTVQEIVQASQAGTTRIQTVPTSTAAQYLTLLPGTTRIQTATTSSSSQVITATTLTPAQLVAAQQRGGTVTVAVPTQLSQAATRLTPQQLNYLKAQALLKQQNQARRQLTPQQAEQLKQQQLKRMAAQQAAVAQAAGQTVVAGSKVGGGISSMAAGSLHAGKTVAVSAPLLTSVNATQVTQGTRLQLAPGQLLTGAQVQQVAAGQAGQPMATLVKTVTSQGGVSMPSVTIPVSAMNLANISVSLPQAKAAVGKAATQQLQQIRLQQLQQRKATQLTQPKQVATLTGSLGTRPPVSLNTVQILPPPGSGKLPAAVTVQQIQQLVKQQAAQGGGIPQIITSLPPGAASTAMLANQILTAPVSTATRTFIATTSTMSHTSLPQTITSISQAAGPVVTGVTLTPAPPPQATATLVKQVQEVIVSPNKTVGAPGTAMSTQLKAAALPGVRQVGAVSVAGHVTGALRPSIAVQQAVQQVQAQAQAQAAGQQGGVGPARFISTQSVVQASMQPIQVQSAQGSSVVTAVSQPVQQLQASAQGTPMLVSHAVSTSQPTIQTVSTATLQPVTQSVLSATGLTMAGTLQTDPKTGQQYTMRLRNPPK